MIYTRQKYCIVGFHTCDVTKIQTKILTSILPGFQFHDAFNREAEN